MTFSERAKPLKEKSRLTLNEIASACNISESMVSRYINGSVIPPEDIARKILSLLGDPEQTPKSQNQPTHGSPTMVREIYEDRIRDLWKTVDEMKAQIRHERKEKWVAFGLLTLVILFVFILLYLDFTNGKIGWYRN